MLSGVSGTESFRFKAIQLKYLPWIYLLRSTDVPLDRKWKHKWKRASTLNHPLQCPWIISWKIFEYNAKLFSVACRTLYGYVNMMKWYWIQLPPISSSKLVMCVCVNVIPSQDSSLTDTKAICEMSANISRIFPLRRYLLVYEASTSSEWILIWKSLLVFTRMSFVNFTLHSSLLSPAHSSERDLICVDMSIVVSVLIVTQN